MRLSNLLVQAKGKFTPSGKKWAEDAHRARVEEARSGAVTAMDTAVLVALASLSSSGYGGVRRSAHVGELSARAGRSEMMVARTMRDAVKEGYAEKAGPRSLQQSWKATEKLDLWYEGYLLAQRP
jgi:hypothetical protein